MRAGLRPQKIDMQNTKTRQVSTNTAEKTEWQRTEIHIILERNKTRQSDHCLPDDILKAIYETMWDENAWWRSIPEHQIEIVKLK